MINNIEQGNNVVQDVEMQLEQKNKIIENQVTPFLSDSELACAIHNYIGHAVNILNNKITRDGCNEIGNCHDLSLLILESMEIRRDGCASQLLLNGTHVENTTQNYFTSIARY